MMKKTFLKKALTLLSAAVMAGAIGLGIGAGSRVSAADGDKATTNVVLTKYASDADDAAKNTSTSAMPDKTKATVAGATYTVYDISSQYWAYVDQGIITGDADTASQTTADIANGKVDGASFKLDDPNATKQKTDENGQTEPFKLNNIAANGRSAVYEFVETDVAKGFDKSSNFVLSLPAKPATDGYVHIYPKDKILNSYQIKFQKVDANNTNTPLAKAEFKITDGKKFAQLRDKDGNPVKTQDNFSAVKQSVLWVSDEADATTFTTAGDGFFGFVADPQTKVGARIYGLNPDTTYGFTEVKAPNGYLKDAKQIDKDKPSKATPAASQDNKDVVYKLGDTPQGILPHTGGKGIIAIVAFGVAMTIIGLVAYNKRRANA